MQVQAAPAERVEPVGDRRRGCDEARVGPVQPQHEVVVDVAGERRDEVFGCDLNEAYVIENSEYTT